jgi:UDP-2,3-diacylglucosamine hydrolase
LSHLFIADLHLSDEQPEIYQRFEEFLSNKARNARALYILGDLFEYYLGDDALSDVTKKVANALDQLVKEFNTKCYFMAGNRDFLLSSGFSKNLTLLNDPTIITLDDKRIILTHADELCTDDKAYQQIRQQIRSKQWQEQFLNQDIAQRIAFAKQARSQSRQHTLSADMQIMDVNQQAVSALFRQHNCHLMIHGHTHRPAFHQLTLANKPHQRMVVGDWHYQSSYIEYKNKHFQLVTC